MTEKYEGIQHIRALEQDPFLIGKKVFDVLGNNGFIPFWLVGEGHDGSIGVGVSMFKHNLSIFCITPKTIRFTTRDENPYIPDFVKTGLFNEVNYEDYFKGEDDVVLLIIDNDRALDAWTLRLFTQRLAETIRSKYIPKKGETRLHLSVSENSLINKHVVDGLSYFEEDVLAHHTS